jgi:hypothetical protein
MPQKEFGLTKKGVRIITKKSPEFCVNIIVSNENCECPLYTYENIPEYRIKAIMIQEAKKGNFCEVE